MGSSFKSGPKGMELVALAAVTAVLAAGSSTQQLYATAQEMQKAGCRKMLGDAGESCLRSSSMSYERYEAERSQAAKARE